MKNRVFKIFLIVSISSLLTYIFFDLLKFKENILSIKKYTGQNSSNIVILTGGTNRIKDGLQFVNNFDKSENINFKILVSGTGKGFTKTTLKKQLNSNFNVNIVECCIYLDDISKNTYTNARETSKWTKKHNINEFILITSNYHMPRAILEFRNRMPNLNIFTFPITPKNHDINKWLSSFQTFSLIIREYSKFLIANIRIKIQNF